MNTVPTLCVLTRTVRDTYRGVLRDVPVVARLAPDAEALHVTAGTERLTLPLVHPGDRSIPVAYAAAGPTKWIEASHPRDLGGAVLLAVWPGEAEPQRRRGEFVEVTCTAAELEAAARECSEEDPAGSVWLHAYLEARRQALAAAVLAQASRAAVAAEREQGKQLAAEMTEAQKRRGRTA